MKPFRLVIALACIAANPSYAVQSCSNTYIRVTPQLKKESALYLLKVPQGFDSSSIDIKATYDSVSARQKPTHNCVFTQPFHKDSHVGYGNWYEQGACRNNNTGRVTSIYGGSGYLIGDDGNTTTYDGCYGHGSACALIEDSNGNRIVIDNDIANSLAHVHHLIRDCSNGSVEGINRIRAFPGYIIIEHSSEKGYVNTYNSAPNIKF